MNSNLGPINILIISALYPPEPVVSARMAYDLASHLSADSRNMVTVICPQPSRPMSEKYTEFQCKDTPLIVREGSVEVVRLPSFAAPASRMFSRFMESWSFGRHVTKYLENVCKQQPDVIYVNAWPLLAQALIANYALVRKIPVILQIMDIYPESLCSKLPVLVGGLVTYPLLRLDAWIARSAQRVIVISDNMLSKYTTTRRIPSDCVSMIPTWQDESLYRELPDRKFSCRKYGISETLFTFLYLGNIGTVAGVDFIIKAFHKAELASAQLLIVGDGARKSACMEYVAANKVEHVHFISDPDVTNVPVIQSMAHVCLLPVCKGAGLSSIPSKLSSYMFSAKPVIATVDAGSDMSALIGESGCGWVGEPENLIWLKSKLKEVSEYSEDDLSMFGECGRQFADAHFSKSQCVAKLSQVIVSHNRSTAGEKC